MDGPQPIAVSRAERKKEALLIAIAERHSAQYHESDPAPLIGGTALKHVLGITRPTTDLDFAKDRPERRIAQDEIVPILRELGLKTRNISEDASAPQWTIEYRKWWFGKWEQLKVDEPTSAGHVNEEPRKVKGITTYSERGLVRSKMQAILFPRQGIPRIKARDLYDCAWIATHRAELLSDAQIAGLSKLLGRLKVARIRAQWENAFKTDPVMQRSSLREVMDALREGLLREKKRRPATNEATTRKRNARVAKSPETHAKQPRPKGSRRAKKKSGHGGHGE